MPVGMSYSQPIYQPAYVQPIYQPAYVQPAYVQPVRQEPPRLFPHYDRSVSFNGSIPYDWQVRKKRQEVTKPSERPKVKIDIYTDVVEHRPKTIENRPKSVENQPKTVENRPYSIRFR